MRKSYVDGRWGQVHVRTAGHGDPLILLHQSPLSGDQFSAGIPYLVEGGVQVIALDMPGYGGSDAPPGPASIVAHAEALSGVIDALGLERVDVLGNHTGASIAAALAAGPERARVRRLILNGVALLSDAERAHFAGFRFAPLEPKADGSHLLAAWNQRLQASPGWTDLKAMHRHCATMLTNPDRYFWAFEGVFAHDTHADLLRIEAPTLVFSNTGDDLYEASKRAHALRPDWSFAALEGGTHDIVDEQPEAWAAAVLGYLRG
ncbi:alpha/beta fold hydrolase [Polymorphobacter sp.]|uniref:alpha/beta fold hydrolase n=1 Tax=Polymorphobacter sp. TaxID=1909290 RepID=UPI003F717B43